MCEKLEERGPGAKLEGTTCTATHSHQFYLPLCSHLPPLQLAALWRPGPMQRSGS